MRTLLIILAIVLLIYLYVKSLREEKAEQAQRDPKNHPSADPKPMRKTPSDAQYAMKHTEPEPSAPIAAQKSAAQAVERPRVDLLHECVYRYFGAVQTLKESDPKSNPLQCGSLAITFKDDGHFGVSGFYDNDFDFGVHSALEKSGYLRYPGFAYQSGGFHYDTTAEDASGTYASLAFLRRVMQERLPMAIQKFALDTANQEARNPDQPREIMISFHF